MSFTNVSTMHLYQPLKVKRESFEFFLAKGKAYY